MKRFLLISVLALSGCLAPSEKAASALKKVATAEAKVASAENDQTKFAAVSAHGVDRALGAAKPGDRAVEVARTMNERTQLALPQPSAADAVAVEKLVDALLAERKGSAEALAEYDRRLAGLQAKIADLEKARDKAEVKRDDTLVNLSSLADLGSRVHWIFWIFVFGLGVVVLGPVLLRLLAIFVPATGPIAGVGSYVLGKIGGSLIRAVPGAADQAGYVASSTYTRVSNALDDVVGAVQTYRKTNPTAETTLDPILREATGPRDSQVVIREVKEKLKRR